MYFEIQGLLLRRAASALLDDVLPAVADDLEARRRVEAIAQFVGEAGCAWNDLFATLHHENELLQEGIAAAQSALGDASAGPAAPTGDPLAEHAALVRTLSAAVDELYERDGSDAVLHAVRRTVQEAAETETRTWRAARARWQAGLAEQELAGVTGTMVNSVRRKQS